MDKTRNALEYKKELGGEERIIFVSHVVRWFELIAIKIFCLSCQTFVMYKV